MIRRSVLTVLAGAVFSAAVACGGGTTSNDSAPPAAAAPAAAPAASAPAASVTLLEPMDGAMGGHLDFFRWTAVDGADDYVIRIQASDGRVVWEAPLTTTETTLPPTVALEPEVHSWNVTARKGGAVLVASATHKFTITP